MGPDLNTNAQILANAIRQGEGGDNYSTSGDGGNSWGAYQFQKGAWDNAAKLAGVNAVWGKATPAQQNQVADTQIKQWLQEGKNPAQIASMWNAGAGEPNAYTGQFSNGQPSVVPGKFDVPGYTKKVLNTASSLWQAHQADLGTSALQAPGQIAGALGGAAGQAGKELGPVGTTAALGAGALGVAGSLAAAPEVAAGGAMEGAGGLLDSASGLLGDAGSAIRSGISGIGSLLGLGGKATQQTDSSTSAAQPSAAAQILASENAAPQQTKSPLYNTIQTMLGSMVGGQQVLQEAQNRGVDPIAEMERAGAIPQPDENGILDKETPIGQLQSLVAQDKTAQQDMASTLTQPTFLGDLEKEAIAEAESKMAGSPNLSSTKEKIHKMFDSYREEQPTFSDARGVVRKRQHVTPKTLQLMKDRATEGADWSAPYHERKAAQHVYHAMKHRLSTVAKSHKVQGWDETNKRMEARLLAIKAIKKMPKKAERDKFKEFRHEIAAAMAGAAIGKITGGNRLAGALAGYLIDRKLGKNAYKNIGTQAEIARAQQHKKQPQVGLLSRPQPSPKKDNNKGA